MEENITIPREKILRAYRECERNGWSNTKAALEHIYGKDTFKPKDITERVKTFKDAVRELGDNHPLVLQYKFNFGDEGSWNYDKYSHELEAYLKLRIITAALNEGWEPKYTKGEIRWFCWYDLLPKEQYDKLTDEDKRRCVLRSGCGANAYSGLACAYASNASSHSYTHYGGRLAFKSEKLAEYAARQFIEIYADFCFLNESR